MKNKKEVNIAGICLDMEIPERIYKEFSHIAEREKDFVGEKLLHDGYLLKEEENKVAMTIQRADRLYSAKMKYSSSEGKWKFDGEVYRWENIEHLVIS